MLLTSLYITIALFVFMFFVNIGVQLVKLLFRLIHYLIKKARFHWIIYHESNFNHEKEKDCTR